MPAEVCPDCRDPACDWRTDPDATTWPLTRYDCWKRAEALVRSPVTPAEIDDALRAIDDAGPRVRGPGEMDLRARLDRARAVVERMWGQR